VDDVESCPHHCVRCSDGGVHSRNVLGKAKNCHPGNRASARLSGTHEHRPRKATSICTRCHVQKTGSEFTRESQLDETCWLPLISIHIKQSSPEPRQAGVHGSRAPPLTRRPRDDKHGTAMPCEISNSPASAGARSGSLPGG
jgi:hypothetical protein